MDNKSSASNFSLAELRDLFTIDTSTECQTHDLLACDCDGNGSNVTTESEAGTELSGAKATGTSHLDENEEDLPFENLVLPGVMRASEIDMEKIEEVRHSMRIPCYSRYSNIGLAFRIIGSHDLTLPAPRRSRWERLL